MCYGADTMCECATCVMMLILCVRVCYMCYDVASKPARMFKTFSASSITKISSSFIDANFFFF